MKLFENKDKAETAPKRISAFDELKIGVQLTMSYMTESNCLQSDEVVRLIGKGYSKDTLISTMLKEISENDDSQRYDENGYEGYDEE